LKGLEIEVPTKTMFLWGENPLQKPLFPLMIGIYIHIMESQREAPPPSYNPSPRPPYARTSSTSFREGGVKVREGALPPL